MFLENEVMYGASFEVSDAALDKDFTIPVGKAKIEREGTDITITCFARMVGVSMEAAKILQEQHGINAEVINLRTLRPLDRETVVKSVKKTNRLINVEDSWPQCGIGA